MNQITTCNDNEVLTTHFQTQPPIFDSSEPQTPIKKYESPINIKTPTYVEKDIIQQYHYSDSPLNKFTNDFSPLVSPRGRREQLFDQKLFDRKQQHILNLLNSPSPNIRRVPWDIPPFLNDRREMRLDYENIKREPILPKIFQPKMNYDQYQKFDQHLLCGESLVYENNNNVYIQQYSGEATTGTPYSSQTKKPQLNHIEKENEKAQNIKINQILQENLDEFSIQSKKFNLNAVNSLKINQHLSTSEIFGEQLIDENILDNNYSLLAVTNKKRVTCNCVRSKCLKLYCDCFKDGLMCQDCNCINCHNNTDNIEERDNALRALSNVSLSTLIVQDQERNMNRHKKGCNCKRSGCVKKYCECFQLGVKCSDICRCEGCENCEEKKQGDSEEQQSLIKKRKFNENEFTKQEYDDSQSQKSEDFNKFEVFSNEKNSNQKDKKIIKKVKKNENVKNIQEQEEHQEKQNEWIFSEEQYKTPPKNKNVKSNHNSFTPSPQIKMNKIKNKQFKIERNTQKSSSVIKLKKENL